MKSTRNELSIFAFPSAGALAGFVLALSLIHGVAARGQELPEPASVTVSYDEHIAPIIKRSCDRCHGATKQQSEYRLDVRETAIMGGEIGGAIVVGKSAESPLIKYVAGLDPDIEMPPSGDPLTPEEIGLLRAWIDQGLVWSAKVEVAELEKPKLEKATLADPSERVTAIAFAPNGILAAAGGESLPFRPGGVTFWDVAAEKELMRLGDYGSLVWTVAFSPDGQKLATGTYDKGVSIWNVETREQIANLEGHKNWVTAVAFSPDGTTLATGSEDTTIKLWDAAAGTEKATLSGHEGTVRSIAFSDDGKTLVSGSQDGTVKVWDLDGGGGEKTSLDAHEGGVFAVSFAPDGERLATAGADRKVRVWSVASGKALVEVDAHRNWVLSATFSRNGRILATGSYDNLIKLWDAASGVELKEYPGHESAVWSLGFSPDNRTLASGSQDGTVKLWDVSELTTGPDRRFGKF